MGGLQSTCGAVSGAIMVLGCCCFIPTDRLASKQQTYLKVKGFMSPFNKIYPTSECLRLLGVDISTDQGYTFAKKHNLFGTRCEQLVTDCVKLLETMVPATSD
jgi:C_GCAxxG_C_C family probable redox protein